jgi:hypothetical protein
MRNIPIDGDSNPAPPTPMPSHGYGGAVIAFEGGVRGGAISEPETMPAQYKFQAKTGYDEHRSARRDAAGTVHGLPGVEGIEVPHDKPGDPKEPLTNNHGEASDGGTNMTQGTGDGFACGHGACGMRTKSAHGLARHVRSAHGFGALGKRMTHGSNYDPGHKDDGPSGESTTGGEELGESEGPRGQERIRQEYEKPLGQRWGASPPKGSSY